MNSQEIFNKVTRHLLTQKDRAYAEHTGCVYLDKNTGFRCAVGCLIPDNHPGLDYAEGLDALLEEFPDLDEMFDNYAIPLMEDLQELHDASDYEIRDSNYANRLSFWRGNLRKLGKKWNLETSVFVGLP